MKYYIADEDDPIIKAFHIAYPGVFNTLDKMPSELRKHLRYPRELYYMQMMLYAKYHQTQPALFYEQAETWQFAKINKKLLCHIFRLWILVIVMIVRNSS